MLASAEQVTDAAFSHTDSSPQRASSTVFGVPGHGHAVSPLSDEDSVLHSATVLPTPMVVPAQMGMGASGASEVRMDPPGFAQAVAVQQQPWTPSDVPMAALATPPPVDGPPPPQVVVSQAPEATRPPPAVVDPLDVTSRPSDVDAMGGSRRSSRDDRPKKDKKEKRAHSVASSDRSIPHMQSEPGTTTTTTTTGGPPSEDQENRGHHATSSKKDKKDKKSKKAAKADGAAGIICDNGGVTPRIGNIQALAAGFHRPSSGHTGPHIKVSVKGMSPLQPDPRVVHPFVRLCVIDGRMAQSYVPTSDAALDCITYPFDLRSRQSIAPYWGDDVRVPVTDDVLHPTAAPILLVEVLDFGSTTINGEYFHDTSCNHNTTSGGGSFYRVAWGFLQLKSVLGDDLALKVSTSANIQLFYYAQEAFGMFSQSLLHLLPSWFSHPAMHAQQPYFVPPMPGTVGAAPHVFYVYCNPNNRKIAYPGGIMVDVGYQTTGSVPFAPSHVAAAASPLERQLLQALVTCGADAGRNIEVVSRSLAMQQRSQQDNPYVSDDYRRLPGERVVPPTTVIHETRVHGAITAMAFTTSGRLLALAISTSLQTLLDIRDVLSNRCSTIGLLRGHADRIHHIAFSSDETLLLSCSSDKTVKVWSMAALPCIVTSSIEEAIVCLATLPHSFPVYSGVFLQSNHLVTAGYDTRLHVWKIDAAERASKLTAVVPNQTTSFFLSVASCESSRVWTLDSAGYATSWRAVPDDAGEITQLSVRRRVECSGAELIVLAPPYGFLPCPRDGACYVLELSSFTVLHRVHGIGKELGLGFSALPDGKLFVVGTKTGRMMAWEAATGDMCSRRDGAARGQVGFPVAKMAWVPTQQMCAVASAAGLHTVAATVAAEHPEPADTCMLAILGEVRAPEKVLLDADPRSNDLVRLLFGGELAAHRSVGAATVRGSTSSGGILTGGAAAARGAPAANNDGRLSRHGDRLSRMEQIVGFWKNLVGGQKRSGSGTTRPNQV